MDNAPNSASIIANLTKKVESLFTELNETIRSDVCLNDDAELFNLENNLQKLSRDLADHITGIKLQQHLNKPTAKESSKAFVKALPIRMKNMGKRVVKIAMLGGSRVSVVTDYYHRKATIKKHAGRCGAYPGLLLVGIADHQSPALESLVSLLATASSSFCEASELIQQTLEFRIDIKTIRNSVKRFAEKVRSAAELDRFSFPDSFAGRVVGASTDGGRIRIRQNKRGNKTKKNRTRYKTDWR